MNHTVPERESSAADTTTARWMTVIYNNDTNSFDEVVLVLMHATQCDLEEASIETWEAHTYGKAAVHFASKETCETVARMITVIGVRTEVVPEWDD